MTLAGMRHDAVVTSSLEDSMSTPQTTARKGDWIVAQGFRGARGRRGEVLEVLGAPGHHHYRVRWEDGHESILYPTDGVVIEPAPPPDR
jgi:FtsP/CotA-like multicopper oxidase with cupredoxin domain